MISHLRRIDISRDINQIFDLLRSNREWDKPLSYTRYNRFSDFEQAVINMRTLSINDLFVICNDKDCVEGVIYSFEYRMNDLNCKIDFFYSKVLTKHLIKKSVSDFCEYLFREYPLKKMFYYGSSSLSEKKEVLVQNAFIEECTLTNYYFEDGTYKDCIVLGRDRI